ncbi:hypothetical protein YC2023_045609 [Brassica napus]
MRVFQMFVSRSEKYISMEKRSWTKEQDRGFEIPTDCFRRTPHNIWASPIFFPISLFLSAPHSPSLSRFPAPPPFSLAISGESPLILPHNHIRPRQRRSRSGMGSQSRGSSSHFQDSVSPHSSYHTSPSPLLAPAAPAPAAAPAPTPPGPPGVMSVAELVRQPGRDRLPYLTEYPHGHGQTWFNRSGNGISAWINRMMYSALDKGHPTFTHFPLEKQHLWFRQFATF